MKLVRLLCIWLCLTWLYNNLGSDSLRLCFHIVSIYHKRSNSSVSNWLGWGVCLWMRLTWTLRCRILAETLRTSRSDQLSPVPPMRAWFFAPWVSWNVQWVSLGLLPRFCPKLLYGLCDWIGFDGVWMCKLGFNHCLSVNWITERRNFFW